MRMSSARAASQRGLTLIEFMVAIVLGMIMVAALATLIANQSANRAEVDRAGRLIENGRYALQAITQDVQMAGYWGELIATPAAPGTLSDPCATDIAGANNLQEAMGVHVQGYDSPAASPLACIANFKPGTDILVVRHADPDTSAVETGGVVQWNKVKPGQVYLQTGINTATNAFGSVLAKADGATDAATFTLKRRDKITVASPRKYLVHIYYVATCSVCTGGAADAIPTLKRVELGVNAGAAAMGNPISIAEGIENLQVDYGNDTDGDGAADGADQNGSTCNAGAANPDCAGGPLPAYTVIDWSNVMTLKIHLLARGTDASPGYSDNKSYALGTASAAATGDGYRRHAFVQSVRIVNPASRRSN